MAKQIIIDHVFKVFGDAPQAALELVRQGCSKQEILAKTGSSIGVFDASFTIEAGEIFVVMGLSGSGKSTLVRLLNLLIEPTAGRILIDGVDISNLTDKQLRALRRKDISMVFQSFALMPHMTVLDNTAFGLELAGVDRAERHAQAAQALEQVGKPVFYYTWTPYWVSAKMRPGIDVVWLEVPFSSLPGEQAKLDTKMPNGKNYGFVVNMEQIVANKKFVESNPAAGKLFEVMKLSVTDVSAQNKRMSQGENTSADIERHTNGWIKAHQKTFDSWIAQSLAAAK